MEVPGVEPGSGSQALKTVYTLSLPFNFHFITWGQAPCDRAISGYHFLTVPPENRHCKSLSLSTPFIAWTGTSYKGRAAFLIKQPKHSYSWHLFFRRLFYVHPAKARRAVLSAHGFRRSHITPKFQRTKRFSNKFIQKTVKFKIFQTKLLDRER